MKGFYRLESVLCKSCSQTFQNQHRLKSIPCVQLDMSHQFGDILFSNMKHIVPSLLFTSGQTPPHFHYK